MKIVVFGLSISSSWGNGHATLWRGLCRALGERGHHVTFFERDVPWYASHRDAWEIPGCQLELYSDWDAARARRELSDADVGMVTSYCPDAVPASDLVLSSNVRVRSFYDLDTPVTLSRLDDGHAVEYLPPYGLGLFDMVLSYTGGEALTRLQNDLGAKRVAPLYGSVDPSVHMPAPPSVEFRADLSYLGTYAQDRQQGVEEFLVSPATLSPRHTFIIGGAQYPEDFPWTNNILFVRHLPPPQHAAFYCSSRMTLNVTRAAMARMGFCPSGRLFEAAACGVPIITDVWDGLDSFYTPGEEILTCRTSQDVLDALRMDDGELRRIATAARERTLEQHTADKRAEELVTVLEEAQPYVGNYSGGR